MRFATLSGIEAAQVFGQVYFPAIHNVLVSPRKPGVILIYRLYMI